MICRISVKVAIITIGSIYLLVESSIYADTVNLLHLILVLKL